MSLPPNRLLVLALTLTITARVLYGLWRMRTEELRPAPVTARGRGQVREGLRYIRRVPALSVSLDKALAKRMVRTHGIRTPDYVVMHTGKERLPKELQRFPLLDYMQLYGDPMMLRYPKPGTPNSAAASIPWNSPSTARSSTRSIPSPSPRTGWSSSRT